MDIKEKKVEGKKCPVFRVSFPHVFEPVDFEGDEKFKYRLTMLFPKDADLTELKRAAQNARIEALGKDKKKWPANLVSPFNDGATKEDLAGYEDTIFVTASSKDKPQIVDRHREPITDPEDFYPGCYAKASLIAFYYDVGKNKGVSFALQNLQKVKDGENLSGKPNAEDDFEDIELDDTDSDSSKGYDDSDGESEELGF